MTLARRMSGHKSCIKRYLIGKTLNYCSSFKVIECGDAVIELIEETDDERRETHWIRELGACNQRNQEYSKTEYNRKYHQENRDEIYRKQAEKIQCDHCGSFIRRKNRPRHKRTKRCLEFVQEPVFCDAPHLTLIEQPTV